MTFLKKVIAIDEMTLEAFLKELEDWVSDSGNSGNDVMDLFEDNPELAESLDVGDENQVLYRGFGMFEANLGKWLDQEWFKPSSHKRCLSWSKDKETAIKFASVHTAAGAFGFVVGRKIAKKDRIIDLEAYGINVREAEVLCKAVPLSIKDIVYAQFSEEEGDEKEVTVDQLPELLDIAYQSQYGRPRTPNKAAAFLSNDGGR